MLNLFSTILSITFKIIMIAIALCTFGVIDIIDIDLFDA